MHFQMVHETASWCTDGPDTPLWLYGRTEHLCRYQKIWDPHARYARNLIWYLSLEVRCPWRRRSDIRRWTLWGSWWIYQRTLAPMVWHSWFMFVVRTLLLCAIILVEIFTCPPLWPSLTLWRRWFTLGLLILSFLDEEQWEPYDGTRYVTDKAMMWKKRKLWCWRRRENVRWRKEKRTPIRGYR
jgi:hypothetical protein